MAIIAALSVHDQSGGRTNWIEVVAKACFKSALNFELALTPPATTTCFT